MVSHAEVIVRHLGELADYILLDLGVSLDETNRHILSGCHHVVVSIEPQRPSLMVAQALLGEMTQSLSLAPHRISVVVINKTPSATAHNKEMLEGLLQHSVVGVVTPASDLAFQSAERGMPMVMMQPNSLVVKQIQNIAEHLVGA